MFSLPGHLMDVALSCIIAGLEIRVGTRLASQMSSEQLDEFEVFIDADDETGARAWLQTNFPEYVAVALQELQACSTQMSGVSGFLRVLLQ